MLTFYEFWSVFPGWWLSFLITVESVCTTDP
jgi:hypothetical protein